MTGIPTVLHVHEIYGKLRYRFLGAMGFFSICLEHIIFWLLRFDKYLCVSNYTKNNLRIAYGIRDDKLLTVYNAIDYEFRKPAILNENLREQYHIEDKKIVLFFGRPGVAKGLDDVIQSIPKVIDADKSIHYVLVVPQDTKKKVGFIPWTIDESKYEHIMRHYNANITMIPGAKRDILKAWVQTADLVVLPSHAEGFGFAIAEVCAMDKPLITTNVSAIPEVVSGEVMFVEPGSPKQIASTITAYFNGTAEIHHIPQKIFTWDKCIASVLEVYNSLFRSHKPKLK